MNDKDINLIEDYIEGKLHGKALLSFESRLKTDESLTKEYNQRIKLAKLWIDADDYSATKEQIGKILYDKNKNAFRTNKFYIFSIAATITILIGVYLLFFHTNNTNDTILENQFADAHDSIGNKKETIVFQYDEPVKLAAIDSVNINTKLLFPIKGEAFYISQSITFKWESGLNNNDTLFVSNEIDGKILLKSRIKLSDSSYTIKYPQFTKGKYKWYISDDANYEKFEVIGR